MRESRIRDLLAADLDIVEPGLTHLGNEFHLPNEHGTRGYVDILARDRLGKIVIIEVKRSRSTSREAIHELFKYAALFRARHGLGANQVRCVLLATDWSELRVPFSEYVRVSDCETEGKQLVLDDDGAPVATRTVPPLDNPSDLAIAPWHHVFLYESAEARDSAAEKIPDLIGRHGCHDYIFVDLDHTRGSVVYSYAIYLAVSLENPDRKLERRVERLYDLVQDALVPDSAEIGYPDKFRQVLAGWEVGEIHRGGRFASAEIWPADALQALLRSDRGRHSRSTSLIGSPRHRPSWAEFRTDVDDFFASNEAWRTSVNHLLDGIGHDGRATVSIRSFNPCDLTTALLHFARTGRTDAFPRLEVVIHRGDRPEPELHAGRLRWDGKTRPQDPARLIGDEFPGGLDSYFDLYHFDRLGDHEDALLTRHGLFCEVFEVEDGPPGEEPIVTFLRANSNYVEELADLFHVVEF
ncbi:endonuclease NucS domain-containing protein [Saccharothrix sp. HUAS TT1]|uniref:endonuclease NucS domain-containing protein n=1 Tax=unclassified Saccharothrix TaxID=2593673 RepID=UPI00345BF4AD